MFIFGGRLGTKRLGDFCVLDTDIWQWSELTSFGDLPSPRDFAAASSIGNHKIVMSELLHTIAIYCFSLNWQHQLCKSPKPNPDIKTLFIDHSCGQLQPNGARAPSPVTNALIGSVAKPAGFPPLGAHGPFQPAPAPLPTSLSGWMANPSPVPHPSVSAGPIGFTPPNTAALLKHPRTPPTNNPAVDYQTADSEHVLKRTRTFGISDEVNHLPVNILPVGYIGQNHGQSSYSSDDLPKAVVMTLSQGSTVKSMDFHPVQQILLLVGASNGEIMIWELGSREKITHKNFKVWDLSDCSMPLQISLGVGSLGHGDFNLLLNTKTMISLMFVKIGPITFSSLFSIDV